MRILIVTQKVDKEDDNLGFFHRWLEEFAKSCETVTVIALAIGPHSLPRNVVLFDLGKGKWRGMRLLNYFRFLLKAIPASDAIFFHMNPEFVLAASPFLLFSRKPSALWYVHKSVTRRLVLAERLVSWIFTASELSFRLPSKKVIYTGHAIDTDLFRPVTLGNSTSLGESNFLTLRLLTVGRISPVKDLETVVRACAILQNTWDEQWILSIVGGPLLARDEEYLKLLKRAVAENGLEARVHFYGSRPFGEIPDFYREHDIFISMSTTGSIDKSVLEAMSSGLTVVTANEAFRELLSPRYFLERRSPETLSERIKALAHETRPNTALREMVREHHDLSRTVEKILELLKRSDPPPC